MKMQAVQSALAVRRQRSRRDEIRKGNSRRGSSASAMSHSRNSFASIGSQGYDRRKGEKKSLGHVTMFHIGGVLILIGLILVLTSLMPGYIKSTTPERRNELLGTGSFFVILGGILTTVSRFISNHEEKELNRYIKGQLARSRSAQRLERGELDRRPSTPVRELNNGNHTENMSTRGDPHGNKKLLTTRTSNLRKSSLVEHTVINIEDTSAESSSKTVLPKVHGEDKRRLSTSKATSDTEGLLRAGSDKQPSRRNSRRGSAKIDKS